MDNLRSHTRGDFLAKIKKIYSFLLGILVFIFVWKQVSSELLLAIYFISFILSSTLFLDLHKCSRASYFEYSSWVDSRDVGVHIPSTPNNSL